MVFSVKCKNAIVTGAAAGIGLGQVKAMLCAGLNKCVIMDNNADQGQKVTKDLQNHFGEDSVSFIKTNVANAKEFQSSFQEAKNKLEKIDILINNAGILNDANWELEVAINLAGMIRGTFLGLEYMSKEKSGNGGVILNVASICGLDPFGCLPVYVATKHGILGFTRCMSKPFHTEKSAVTFRVLCPGVTETELVNNTSDKLLYNTPEFHKLKEAELMSLPHQTVEYLSDATVDLIERGQNGSIWVVEGEVYEIEIKPRQERKKYK